MPEFEDIDIKDLPDFSGDDAAYCGEATLGHEALEAGVKINPSKLPTFDTKDYEVVVDNNYKPPTLT